MKIDVSFLDDLERRIRLNQAPKLKDLTSTIRPKGIPRSLTFRYANLLKRMGGAYHAIRLLNPIIRNTTAKPSNLELIEYAACLTKLNLSEESIELLNSISNEKSPEIHFERAAAYMIQWDYLSAREHLEKFLACSENSEYRICVGELNLGASYIYTNEASKADKALKQVLDRAKKGEFKLLCGNALELLAQSSILKKDFVTAEKFLKDASTYMGTSNPRYILYIEKVKVMRQLFTEDTSPDLVKRLGALRAQAADLRNWNTLRDIELFTAIATQDDQKIHDLYYGVPYPEYRKRILSFWEKPLQLSETYDKKIGRGTPQKIFDVTKGIDLHSKQQLSVGKTLHRLVQCLTSDFYAPFSATRIFSIVFRGVYFNPDTSQQQVYEAIKRLNKWFQDHEIDLRVMRGQGGYRLRSEKGYILRIKGTTQILTRPDDFLTRLLDAGLSENFSLKMVVAGLKLPKRSAVRRLSEATDQGLLVRKGKGPATRYSTKK